MNARDCFRSRANNVAISLETSDSELGVQRRRRSQNLVRIRTLESQDMLLTDVQPAAIDSTATGPLTFATGIAREEIKAVI